MTTTPSAPAPVRATVQAQVVVRIISGVHLKLDSDRNEGAPRPRTTVFVSDGVSQPARLIEFE
ncbi:MAG TPA: hypothetical protein VM308_09330 [Sphingomicrobium sp.]|nr:hypothetical protein [Sphingomicrobium sp.]